ncbi:MAG: phospho-N-acetylmuramoyl-pentapeptide-transferase [Patescibacteria group bacterium]
MNTANLEAIRMVVFSGLACVIGMWWGPYLISLLNWLKFYKKTVKNTGIDGKALEVTREFFEETDQRVPRAGGLLIWITTLGVAAFFWVLLKISSEPSDPIALFEFLNFVGRRQTVIPLATLVFGSIVGFVDDALAVSPEGGNYIAGGLQLRQRLTMVVLSSIFIGWWFYSKIGFEDILLPVLTWSGVTLQYVHVGVWIIPITIISLLALYGSTTIDGLDGLAAGVLIPIFLCYAGISYIQGSYELATLIMVIVGSMLAYLWFNLPPAKFYMGDTGTMGLFLCLGVIAFLTNRIYILPIAGIMLVLTEASVILQLLSKKFRGKKIFKAAPLHHHLEAIGWSRSQITVRYWVVSILASILAFLIALIK